MKRSYGLIVAAVTVAILLAAPASALAFQVTGGGGNQTQNPYGYWYAGKEACAQEGCHSAIAAVKTPHSEMVKDIGANPGQLYPAADSGHWPFTSPIIGGISVLPRDIYLQVGDDEGFLEYIGQEGNSKAVNVKPTDDLPVWSPANWLIAEDRLEAQTSKMGNGVYGQSCSQCHNVGQTRPANAKYTLPSGATQTTNTPTTVSELGIQCEACHGSGKVPDGHKKGVPGVVGGYQVLKAQTCGQCHVSGATPQLNVGGTAFGNPNGFTTDQKLSDYLTAYSVVETEGQMMKYVNNPSWPGGTKPRFLPNGADFSMRHTYYNEWLVNKTPVPSGGEHGHADPLNNEVRTAAAAGDTTCLKCHSGLAFLNRVDAKSPSGTRIVGTFPSWATVQTDDPGISCMVCHTGHVAKKEGGGYDSLRRKGNGETVECTDCHNWQYEALGKSVQYEAIDGTEYARPAANARVNYAQREMFSGGKGGSDGTGGMWGVEPMESGMPDVECRDCHMPRTHKEGMPTTDDGSTTGTRMSHRFHVVFPGDAKRWKLRPNGDSCTASCHEQDASEWTRDDFQAWIDQKRSSVTTATDDATGTLGAVATDLGLAGGWTSFMASKPTVGPGSALSPAVWAMLQHAAQNCDFVVTDGSGGIHNPAYATAGLQKSYEWALAYDASLSAAIVGGKPVDGSGFQVEGTLLGLGDEPIAGAEVALEVYQGGVWTQIDQATTDASGDYTFDTGVLRGTFQLRAAYVPSSGVSVTSTPIDVVIPETVCDLTPAGAGSSWVDAASVQVQLTSSSGMKFYSLAGATTLAPTLYTGPFTISAEGETSIRFWSADADGLEAPQVQGVHIDRAAPVLSSDAASGYLEGASVRVSASDSGAGVAKLEYSLDGGPLSTASSTWAVCTTTGLGSHTVAARATDVAGKVTSASWTFAVRTTPALAKSPSKSTVSVRYKKYWAPKVTVTARGGAVAGKRVVLQRSSNGRTWSDYASFTTNASGQASASIKMSRRGTTYWRWMSPEDASYVGVTTAKTKVSVR